MAFVLHYNTLINKGKDMNILEYICEKNGLNKSVVSQRLTDRIPSAMVEHNYEAPGLTLTFFRKILMDDFGVKGEDLSKAFAEFKEDDFSNVIKGVFYHDDFCKGINKH